MKDITPQIWYYFREICNIPRASKNEGKICNYIIEFARKNNLEFDQDKAGNIVIRKPATSGSENKKTVILQCHVDMVCEKNTDVDHDFDSDPIKTYTDGDWMKAYGTTLGADDGIGVAAALAILSDKDLRHAPLEALFTVDEETGLTGARELQHGFLKGDILINLDSEDEGELFIGCAGGVDNVATFRYELESLPPDTIAFYLSITGLTGGHSGDDIHKRRGNAIKILNHILLDSSSFFGLSIARMEGGNLRNAIPREAFATVLVHKDYKDELISYCTGEALLWKDALRTTSPGFCFSIEQCDMPSGIIDIVTQSVLLHSIAACPSGVVSWSETIPGLVETSSNLASVKFRDDNRIEIVTSQRSDSEQAKKEISAYVRSIFEKAEAEVVTSHGYPGWKPDIDSVILKITDQAYQRLFHKKPVVRAIHAGLECGLFLEKYPDLDMISFGPTIKNVHSPSEQLNIPSVKCFSDLLITVLNMIPVKK